MDSRFSRRDIGYTIISRFEEVFRFFLSEKLPIYFGNFLDGIPSGVIDKTKERTQKSFIQEPYDLLEDTDFPDLKEITCYNNMYETYFPDKSFTRKTFEELMEEFVTAQVRWGLAKRCQTQ